MKTLKQVTISGTLRGTIWMPPVECKKDFTVRLTPQHQPFTETWAGIREALLRVTNDGDFQSCAISELYGTVQYNEGDYVLSRGMRFNPAAKDYSDLLTDDCVL